LDDCQKDRNCRTDGAYMPFTPAVRSVFLTFGAWLESVRVKFLARGRRAQGPFIRTSAALHGSRDFNHSDDHRQSQDLPKSTAANVRGGPHDHKHNATGHVSGKQTPSERSKCNAAALLVGVRFYGCRSGRRLSTRTRGSRRQYWCSSPATNGRHIRIWRKLRDLGSRRWHHGR
jgi:hypothetical protein